MTPAYRPYASPQFIEIERFAEVVIRTRIQPFDAIGNLVERGQQEDRGPVATRAQFP